MPAANNLPDRNLADKQHPTGKRLSTCNHPTTSNSATCIPHLQRKIAITLFQICLLLPQKSCPKEEKEHMWPSILSNFPSWSGFWEVCNSEKSAPGWRELWWLLWEINYNTTHSTQRLCSCSKNHSLLTFVLKRWEDPNWMFTTRYYNIQILTTLQYIWRAGNILCHEQMSTMHIPLLQKRTIYH